MQISEIGNYRLSSQGVSQAAFERPEQVVTHLVAMQAQDYNGVLWAIGARLKDGKQSLVEQAIRERKIVRTWPMRGTLHFVAAQDVRWLLKLLTPRVISATAARQRQLEIDDEVLRQTRKVVTRALEGGKELTRQEMYTVLEQGGIAPTGQRGIHLLGRLSQEGLLCLGAHQAKQPTFVLLDEWLPPSRELTGDEAFAELAQRYFTGHGPATLGDFERWAGIKISDARRGLEAVKTELQREEIGGQTYWLGSEISVTNEVGSKVYLLAGFDEFILGYKDRSAVLAPEFANLIVPGGNGVFLPTIVSAGQVVGLWKRVTKRNKIIITPVPFTSLSPAQLAALSAPLAQYSTFLETPVELEITLAST